MSDIIQLIQGVGFPIVMCLLIYYQNNMILKNITKGFTDLTTSISELLDTIEKHEQHCSVQHEGNTNLFSTIKDELKGELITALQDVINK